MPPLKRPSIIDIESSGFGPDSYPIEIGVALSRGQRYSTLVQPVESWDYWDPKAESIHGLSRENLQNYGKPIRQIAEELNALLGTETVYSDGWVVDAPWVDKLFYFAFLARSFRVSPLENVLTEEQMAIWHTTKDEIVSANQIRRHRASTDAMLIQETYVRTRQLTAC